MPMLTTSFSTVGKNAPTQGEYDTIAITPSDSADIPVNALGRNIRRIQVTGAGNVSVNLAGGGTAVLTGLAAGQTVLCGVTRILATGTTATGILGLY